MQEQMSNPEAAMIESLRLLNEAKIRTRAEESSHGFEDIMKGLPTGIRREIDERIAEWKEDGVPEEKMRLRLAREVERSIAAFEDKRFDIPNGSYFRMEMYRLFDELITENVKLEKVKGVGGIFLDVNGLKAVNDIAGHAAGDEYLRRIIEVFKNGKTVENLKSQGINVFVSMNGGDEIAVLLSDDLDMAGPAEGKTYIEKALSDFQEEVRAVKVDDLIDLEKPEIREKMGNVAIPENFRFSGSVSGGTATIQEVLSEFKADPSSDYRTNMYAIEGEFFRRGDERSFENKKAFKQGLENGEEQERFEAALLKRNREAAELMEENIALKRRMADLREENARLRDLAEKHGVNTFEDPEDLS